MGEPHAVDAGATAVAYSVQAGVRSVARRTDDRRPGQARRAASNRRHRAATGPSRASATGFQGQADRVDYAQTIEIMRTIRLELLRHGPPHNQLLSPLTDYLALCENHPAASIQIPFEHAEFMLRLRALQYKDGSTETGMALEDMARPVTRILSSVPGLIRELAEHAGD